MLGHEGVGLMGWCPVSWLSPGMEGRALDAAPRLPASTHAHCSRSFQENPPVHTWTGIPLILVFAFSSGGPPCSLPPAHRVLAFVGITAFESVEIELGPGLPDPRVPTGSGVPSLFGCLALSGQISISKWTPLLLALCHMQYISWN